MTTEKVDINRMTKRQLIEYAARMESENAALKPKAKGTKYTFIHGVVAAIKSGLEIDSADLRAKVDELMEANGKKSSDNGFSHAVSRVRQALDAGMTIPPASAGKLSLVGASEAAQKEKIESTDEVTNDEAVNS